MFDILVVVQRNIPLYDIRNNNGVIVTHIPRNNAIDSIITQIDQDLENATKPIGLKVSSNIYDYMRCRGLIKPKTADFVLWKFEMTSYKDYFIYDDINFTSMQYEVGQ
jgi:hypothetical protein